MEDGQLGSPISLRPDSTYAQSAVWSTLDGYVSEVNFPGWVYVATASHGNCIVFNEDGAITTLTTTEAIQPTNEQLCMNILEPNEGYSVRVRIANPTGLTIPVDEGDGNSFDVRPYRTAPYYDGNPGDVIKLDLPQQDSPFEYTVGESNGCIVINFDGATVVR